MRKSMQGRRVDADKDGNITANECEYGKDGNDNWYGTPPGFLTGYANLSNHEVIEHDNGKITVKPSIECKNHLHYWHGFLKNGFWVSC
jgi:hypothetical protein